MQCKKCGHKLKRNETFCTVCGYYNDEDIDLDENEVIESVIDDYEEEDPKEDDLNLENDDASDEDYSIDDDEPLGNNEYEPYDDFDDKKDKEDEEDYYYTNEDCLEAYIGEDYNIIKKKFFNIYAFLLSWAYVLYRKLYITGILGLLLALLCLLKSKVLLIIYLVVSMVIWGFLFNKYYIFVAKKRIERYIAKSDDTDRYKMVNICAKRGGVSILKALLIYLIFLGGIVYLFTSNKVMKTSTQYFWKENTANKANCLSLVRAAYKNKEELKMGEALEGACSIQIKKGKKQFDVYLKTEYENVMIYTYFTTEGDYIVYKNNTKSMNELMAKKANKTITEEETKLLKEKQIIESTYKEIYDKSIQEDQLIDKKQNKEQKLNYIYSDEEITR